MQVSSRQVLLMVLITAKEWPFLLREEDQDPFWLSSDLRLLWLILVCTNLTVLLPKSECVFWGGADFSALDKSKW